MERKILALMAIWLPENDKQIYNCTIPGFPGVNSAGETIQECIENVQEAFDMINEDVKVSKQHIKDLIDPRHMLDHEDEILVDCVWQVITVTAMCEDNVELSDEYYNRLATFKAYRKKQ